MKKRIKRINAGETIAETLVSLLIVSLSMLMISGAIAAASRINQRSESIDTGFRYSERSLLSDKVLVTYYYEDGQINKEIPADVFQTNEGKYIFYEYKNDTSENKETQP